MNTKKRILVVDDERDLCDILQVNLESLGYEVKTALSADEALDMSPECYDLLLLDVMMDGMSGFELSRMLKDNPATSDLPIIFITARDSEQDLQHGFEAGGDDYVTKPFSLREIQARVRTVLARTAVTSSTLNHEGLRLDLTGRSLTIDGKPEAITPIEFGLLHLLMAHDGQVFTRQQLIEQVWPKGTVVTNRTIDVNITRLRKKLGPYAACVATRVGFGYYFNRYEQAD
ncbi:MAG: response regulator transcription factor [Muribaculaceae bacterium]|nr:response regulator transcription factor [Muribaculaceae bacterium]